jgi:hypothetical protein
MKKLLLIPLLALSFQASAQKLTSMHCKKKALFNKMKIDVDFSNREMRYKSRYDDEVFDELSKEDNGFERVLIGKQSHAEVYLRVIFDKNAIVKPNTIHHDIAVKLTRVNPNGSTVSAMELGFTCKAY